MRDAIVGGVQPVSDRHDRPHPRARRWSPPLQLRVRLVEQIARPGRACADRRGRAARARAAGSGGVNGSPPAPTVVSRPSGSASAHSSASTADQRSFESAVEALAREPQVVAERAHAEDVLLLRDERDPAGASRAAARRDRRLFRARRVNAGEQPAQGRSARARGPNHGDTLARSEVEVDPVQHVPSGDVGVRTVALLSQRYPSGERPATRSAAPTRAGEPGATDLDLVEPRDEPVDRVGQLLRVEHDGRHLADRGVPGVDEPAAPQQPGDDGEHVGDLRAREPEARKPACLGAQ